MTTVSKEQERHKVDRTRPQPQQLSPALESVIMEN